MWHLVCGDLAVPGVTHVIGEAAAQQLRVLRDDLAVGPLADIDSPPCQARAQFWQAVWPQAARAMPDLPADLSTDANWLSQLGQDGQDVTVWTGDSCSEQLLLARVAHALQGSRVSLWEVACANPQRPPRKAVSLRSPAELVELYTQRTRLDPERRQQLAEDWQHAVQANQPIRTWLAGHFQAHSHALVDAPMLRSCSQQWRPLGQVMADAMAAQDGFFPTDFFLDWRASELAQAGQLELRLPPSSAYNEQQVRLPSLSQPVT
ncbi:DUF1835 domain-containing protein [Pseudomonas sp. 5P_3.1_Bac2]|uniref:DUF1835 domain-containing protein n=1 Tax=Pseudomonas sp. 5P_3.1_Bac2 TaxID=2971617 RepID=UPI0021C96382|nr:DUF1835 domain-containing protein [Pseudomonas sp. 5P_3.1_Bac2]MCU1718619.1 DUF1835 domain-containing protein [Pseudomonas sp. 5P_3.1_Bac2]